MSQGTATSDQGLDATEEHADEAGFLILGLAQIVCIFAFWMALWPAAFGLPHSSALGTTLGVLFALGGAVGFYLAFQSLSLE